MLESQRDMLLVFQQVKINGDRIYLAGTSIVHKDINDSKAKRVDMKVCSYYLEPTTDGKGVKITHIVTANGTRQL